MTFSDIDREIARFDPEPGPERARTPPATWYTEPGMYDRERERVFRRTWQVAGRAEQVARPGDCLAGAVAGEPYVVVRGEDGTLRAYFNVCRHHASRIVEGAANLKELVCPYHGWTYGLDGRLRRAPRIGGVAGFHPEDFGLLPVQVDVWGPIVAVNFDAGAPPLAAEWKGLEDFLPPEPLGRLRFVARKSYELCCNWKVYVDNYLDGGYHVAHLHRALAEQMDLSTYQTEVFPRFAIQSCAAAARPPDGGMDFKERLDRGAVYAWIHPNFMINRYGPVMDTNLVLPLGPERTLVVFEWWFEDSEETQEPEFIRRCLKASEKVQEEDTTICESVQIGLSSSAFDRGPYAPALEKGAHHFHRLLRSALA